MMDGSGEAFLSCWRSQLSLLSEPLPLQLCISLWGFDGLRWLTVFEFLSLPMIIPTSLLTHNVSNNNNNNITCFPFSHSLSLCFLGFIIIFKFNSTLCFCFFSSSFGYKRQWWCFMQCVSDKTLSEEQKRCLMARRLRLSLGDRRSQSQPWVFTLLSDSTSPTEPLPLFQHPYLLAPMLLHVI